MATVTMSAPDASCALTMTACDEYLPVPMMRRDANVLPAMEKVFMLSAADKIDDLDLIALAHDGGVKHRTLDRGAAVSWYRRNRDRSRALFDMLPEPVYYSRPIALRHPIVFYEGHLPA